MGTQQALTTEQLEVLILINDICDLIKEKHLENSNDRNYLRYFE